MFSGRRLHRYTYNDCVSLELQRAVGLGDVPRRDSHLRALQQHEPSPKATALNPMVILEVTSDSSEEYDTEDKVDYIGRFPHYGTTSSFLIASGASPFIAERTKTSGRRESLSPEDGSPWKALPSTSPSIRSIAQAPSPSHSRPHRPSPGASRHPLPEAHGGEGFVTAANDFLTAWSIRAG
jgi:hypothetical protein